jgi:uncharacterized protein YutD
MILCALIPIAAQGDCKCRRPEKGDETRWGGNEAVVLVPEEHFREVSGIVEAFQDEVMKGALAEVFDKPDYLVSNKPWNERPNRIAFGRVLRQQMESFASKICQTEHTSFGLAWTKAGM